MTEQLKRNTYYPCADYPNRQELNKLGWVKGKDFGSKELIRVVWTGEKRPPRKGEWYLSGAVIEGYRAPNNLTTEYHIGKLCRVEKNYRAISSL